MKGFKVTTWLADGDFIPIDVGDPHATSIEVIYGAGRR
eukprot:gene32146-32392_t